ncbi:helix-hairpin-helix domain-containing protein [Aquipuribacter sp. MA13-6]|uniref:helix-hairpin-helix domain-containing protein n=1 Tax=unclassified Aquipuribacter TaxID=2635084 RepID=UPI003EEB07D2
MGRDSGDSARLLARLTSGAAARPTSGWSDGDGVPPGAAPGTSEEDLDPFPAGTGTGRAGAAGRGRHVDGAPARRGTAWRVTGVPPGLAVLLLLVAVVGVLLLGRGGGAQEVLVGPTGAAGATTTADGARTEADGAAGDGATGEDGGVVGTVVPGVPPAPGGPEAAGPLPQPGATGVTTGAAAGAGAGDSGGGPLLVHVDGAVARPGVVQLPPGARVGDAVQAAGGATDEADTRLVNLARPLSDGELVVVPRPGEQALAQAAAGAGAGPGAAPGAGPGPGSGAGSGATPSGGLVDLNSADAAVLDELPGIGPVLAERIVAWREESGPFATVDDLTAVSGIGPAVLSDIRDLVTV